MERTKKWALKRSHAWRHQVITPLIGVTVTNLAIKRVIEWANDCEIHAHRACRQWSE